ncbi:hypothetical protein ACYSTM_21120 [Bacillus licheniformis]
MEKCVLVSFEDSFSNKQYAFKNDIEGLEVGDKVVVDTVHGFVVATVAKLDHQHSKATKYVVQKIDVEAHQKRVEKENKIKEIRSKLEARRKQLEEIQIYRILSMEDEEMAVLLNELEKVSQ